MSSILCPKCGKRTSVSETRTRDQLERRRKCSVCGESFWTVEVTKEDYKWLQKAKALIAEMSKND